MLISDTSPVRINCFDSNIIQNENTRILWRFQMDSFEGGVLREVNCLYLISSRVEMCTSSVSNVIYHKFSHGATPCMVNGKRYNHVRIQT